MIVENAGGTSNVDTPAVQISAPRGPGDRGESDDTLVSSLIDARHQSNPIAAAELCLGLDTPRHWIKE